MADSITTSLVETIPNVLWIVFALVVYLTLRRALLPQVSRLTSIKTPGLELGFAERMMDAAAGRVEDGRFSPPPASHRRAAASRLEHAADILRGGHILWADDHPERNEPLVALFRQVGMEVDTAVSTGEALSRLAGRSYDLVVTDMRRETEEPADTAGITLVRAMDERGIRLPVIMYAYSIDPRHGLIPGVFAYATGPDGVVHYVIDLMERVKFGAAA